MDENTKLKLGLFAVLLIGFIVTLFSMNEHDNQVVHTTKIDLLNRVIDSLQTEIFYLEDGFDHREHIYEQALHDCEHQRRFRRQKHKGQLKQQFRYE